MKLFNLDNYIGRCIHMLDDNINPKFISADKRIPETLVRNCEGIAFITIVKAGLFFLGGNVGGGCVIAKVKDPSEERGWRWSGPSSVLCGGLGGGFVFGAEKIDSIIILNTKVIVRSMMGSGQVTLGGNLSLAAGPVGRDVELHVGVASNVAPVAAYSYSKAQGLYIGATLEGAILAANHKDNKKFYSDEAVTPEIILSGQIRSPPAVTKLHHELYAIHDHKGNYVSLNQTLPVGENNALEPNWETASTADGLTYYYNTITNETRWDAPLASSSNSFSPPIAQEDNKISLPFQNNAATGTVNSNHASSSSFQPRTAAKPVVHSMPVIPARPNLSSTQSVNRSAATRPARPVAPQLNKMAVARYPYQSTGPGQISFSESNRMEVLDSSDKNWCLVRFNGQEGYAPTNYLSF